MTPASTKPTESFLDALVTALERAGRYNRNDQSPPAAVLWPDKERQWEPLLSQLRSKLPLITVGPYEPALRQGPAYWVRCMLNGTLGDGWLPEGVTPIVYLPGVSKQEIRAVESCPKPLQPLAELQYRGLIWTQKNGRDWTVQAFLQSEDGGLGIDQKLIRNCVGKGSDDYPYSGCDWCGERPRRLYIYGAPANLPYNSRMFCNLKCYQAFCGKRWMDRARS